MKLKDRFAQMSGSRKKYVVMVGLALLGGTLMGISILNDMNRGVGRKRNAVEQTQVLTPNTRNLTMEDLAIKINAIDQRINQMQLNSANRPLAQGALTAEEVQRMIDAAQIQPPPPLPADGEDAFSTPASAPLMGSNTDEEQTSPYRSVITNRPHQESGESGMGASGALGTTAPTGNTSGGTAGASDHKTYLPPGSTLSFISISGMNAPTNQSAQKDPLPTLLRLRGQVMMPNGFRADLNDCVVLASGFGQMADERAMLRAQKISCVREDGKAIEAKIEGTVFGEDGKPGLRGRLVSKNGEVIAQMIKIGALNTIGQMAVGVAGTVSVNPRNNSGTGNTFNLGVNNQATQAATTAAAAGINDIFTRIAGIYEQYATQTFPVIEVDPGRVGDILLTEGITLDYVRE